jgi:O-antigen ligase
MDGLRDRGDIDRLVRWLVILTAGVAALGIIQYYTGFDIAGLYRIPGFAASADLSGIGGRSGLRRIAATATHPIEFGVVMAGVLPLALHRSLHGPRTLGSWLPTALIGFAMAVSISRSPIVVTAVAFLLIIPSWPRPWRRNALLVAPAAVVGVRLLAPGVVGTIRSLFLNINNDTSVSGRTEDFDVLARIFWENPILGRGLGTFVPQYYRIIDNQVYALFLELGVVGTSAFIAVILTATFSARGARRRFASAEHGHLGLVVSAAIVGLFVSFALYDVLGHAMSAGLVFLLVGLAGALWRVAAEEQRAVPDQAGAPRPAQP